MIAEQAISPSIKLIDLSEISIDINSIQSNLSRERVNYIHLKHESISYNKIWDLQNLINGLVYNGNVYDTILFLEHSHVITFGKNSDKNFLIGDIPKDTELIHTDRGGEITYHGPGQLVIYPILNLSRYEKSITWYMDFIHSVVINWLDTLKIHSRRKKEYPGIWVDDNKICAVGVRIKRWVTMHGLALNISTDLTRYRPIIPCGILECGITSVERERSIDMTIDDVVAGVFKSFSEEIDKFEA